MAMQIDSTPLITLFTPTYNRAHLLPRVYESLCNQDCRDFLWLIVDDGSTDGTEQLVRNYVAEGRIAIEYYKKENGGKHTAYNYCLERLRTELVFIAMDSDDWLDCNAVSSILETWQDTRDDLEIQGLVFLCKGVDGKPLISTYNEDALKTRPSLHDARCSNWFYGEAVFVFRSEYVRNFPYPGHPGERFFNEAYTYVQMTGRMLWKKECIYTRDYQKEGLSDSFLRNIMQSPLNYADYSNALAFWGRGGLTSVKYVLYYDAFSLFGGSKSIIGKSLRPIAATCLLPVGVLISFGLRVKQRRMVNGRD